MCLSLLFITALMVAGFSSAPAGAATLTVTSLADDGSTGTLRSRIAAAAPGDTIDFSVSGTLTLNQAELVISKNLTITGPGSGSLLIHGNNTQYSSINRVFKIGGGITVSISHLSLTGGRCHYANWSSEINGGGIHNAGTLTLSNVAIYGNTVLDGAGGGIYNSGTLTISNSSLSENYAQYNTSEGLLSTNGLGGAIHNTGTMTVSNTTFARNVAWQVGSGITNYGTATITNSTISSSGAALYGGGIYNTNTLTLTNSTLSGNRASNVGGAIFNEGAVDFSNCTVAGNNAPQAGGIFTQGYSARVSLSNSIVAGNTATSGDANVRGTITSSSYSMVSGDPKLGALANNGGPTATMALLSGSPAIGAGDPNFVGTGKTDQRGAGYDRVKFGRLDIGAFELQTNAAPVATVALNTSSSKTNDTLTATATRSDAEGDTVSLTYVWSKTSGGTTSTVQTTSNSSSLTNTLNLATEGNGDKGDVITVTVTPNDGYSDGSAVTAQATIINSAPLANTATFTVAQDGTLTGNLSGSDADGDTFIYSQAGNPSNGNVTVGADGSFSYTPNIGYSGSDSFSFTVNDGIIDSNSATASIFIHEPTQSGSDYVVNTLADHDDGYCGASDCTLREAIKYVPPAGTITFGVSGTIVLTGGELAVGKDFSISGPTSAPGITVSGNSAGRIFNIGSGITVSISSLTIRDGDAYYGYGGGVYNNGTLNLSSSTLSGNNSYVGGGICNYGTLNLVNSTLSSNTGYYAGGIFNSGILNIVNSTLSGNTGYYTGGAIYNAGTLSANNSIIAGNSTGDGSNLNGSIASGDHNLINGDPQLGALANNGGPTSTMAPRFGSPAIGAGATDGAPAADQRGVLRPQGAGVDIGAVEAQQYSISGYVRTNTLAPIVGVSMQLGSGPGAANPLGTSVITDANGFYKFEGVLSGSYYVTPTYSGWGFSPVSQALNVSTASRGANFIGTRTASTYSLSGRIANSSGVALPNVSVALTPTRGGVSTTVLSNSAGYYTFSSVPAGDYTITPTLSGTTFAPASRNVSVVDVSVSGESFIGSTGYKVIGRIMTASGTGISGVEVMRSGVSTPVLSNSAGYYTFYNVPDGEVTLTPGKSGHTFTPASKTVLISGADKLNQNFIGSTGYSVSGRVATSSGVAISGVSVALGGRSTPATTNSAGYYIFYNVPDGQATLTPSKDGYSFTPSEKTLAVNGANTGSQNFVGTEP